MNAVNIEHRSKLRMSLPRFEYLPAANAEEVCSLLSRHKDKAIVIAGGTDLIVQMRSQAVKPQYVINLKAIPELDYIVSDDKCLRVGAMTILSDIATSPVVRDKLSMLADAAHRIGSPQVRNVATIGGNLCNASPAADSASPLLALRAKVRVKSSRGDSIVALEEFFKGPGQTILKDDEILAEVEIPYPPPHTGGIYIKLPARTSIDLAVVGVAAVITLDPNTGSIADVRIALGAVAPTPVRARNAEHILKGKSATDALIEQAAQVAADEVKPISDIRGTADYRKEIVRTLTTRAVKKALGLAINTSG